MEIILEFLIDLLEDLLLRWTYYRNEKLLGARSSLWRKTRKEFVKNNPTCAITGDTRRLEVHHIKDYSHHPELELDPDNLIVLRRDIHFIFGHLLNWKSINKDIKEDSRIFLEKIRNRP